MSLRQRISSDIAAGRLTHSPLVETSADRIGALGRSDPLGAALWRILADHDVAATRASVALLLPRLKNLPRMAHGRDIASRVCKAALGEWLADKCQKCQGRGLVYNSEGVAHACTACEGTRLARHSDTHRAKVIGLSKENYMKWEHVFAQAHVLLADAELRVGRQLAHQLERGLR